MTEYKMIAVIPTYMPDEKMVALVELLHDGGFEIVVVNDGSSEDKNEIFEKAAAYATVLTHEKNKGKGAALKTAFDYIRRNYAAPYTVVTADADGQHSPDDILRVSKEAATHTGELVLGSRKIEGNAPLRSRFGNAVTRAVYRIATGCGVYDTQTGLRSFSSGLIEDLLSIDGSRYEYEMNVLLAFAKNKIKIREVPIKTIYLDNNSSSHFNTVKDSFRIYKEILKFSASSFLSFIIDYSLFCALYAIIGSVIIPNIIARMISSVINYTLNRNVVFKSKTSVAVSAVKYFSLALCILILNTVILKALVTVGIDYYFAKLLTETVMFIVSWLVQRMFIFKEADA